DSEVPGGDLGLDPAYGRHQAFGHLLGGAGEEPRVAAQALVELACRAREAELVPHLGHAARQALDLGFAAAMDLFRRQVEAGLDAYHRAVGDVAARVLADADAVGRLPPVLAGELVGEPHQGWIDLFRDDAPGRLVEVRGGGRVDAVQAIGRHLEHA